MAVANETKTKYLAVISIFPELILTMKPEKFEYIKLQDGTHKQVRMQPDYRLEFNRHVAYMDANDLETLRGKFRYGTEFITTDDLRELDKSPEGRTTANGIRSNLLRASHRAKNPIGSDSTDVMELIKDADAKAKAK